MDRGGVTYPEGFVASGINCGIKKGKNDLSLIFSESECVAAGTFTTNQFKSYSLLISLKNIENPIRAILINSGNANACNGKENLENSKKIIIKLSEILGIPSNSILFASTGIIGKPLPYEKIINSLPELVEKLSTFSHTEAAMGIMTTDRKIKEFHINTGIIGRKKEVVIGGMAKGAGMVNPNMATMLAFITTDAVIHKDALKMALKDAVDDSFNMINIDNDTSTNDMVVCLANGLARNRRIHPDTPEYEKFAESLKEVCRQLARKIAEDGEGSDKLIEVVVKGGWCKKDVRRVAKKVAGSNLVKSAIAGNWLNWGRIISAIGSTNARIDLKKIEISINGIKIYKGEPLNFPEKEVEESLKRKVVRIEIDLKRGKFETISWGCDLTEEYVRINRGETDDS
ncbi:MAG TPA: bifunctional glutamate N-acetyltransferase/amino-acid acetyltransferase ArgJ [Firmicutes bacterium]|nr:MAG: ornithine acetyltransferase [Candidatus Omnitrophota bacterium]HDD65043.1 bifunctional glutamate N-acetyltransferase/amino-acid acetyltransferase ArgJ [Bacillota bacterium]